MSNQGPCAVYLDTSDYSRFGDLLRGKPDAQAQDLYDKLLVLKASGEAIFPCSAPMLAELLQYDAGHRETTVCKAKAVEALAGEYAFIFPTRLVCLEIARAAHCAGLRNDAPEGTAISDERYWFPNLGNGLANLRTDVQKTLSQQIEESGYNRQARRAAKAKSRKLTMTDLAEAMEKVVPQFARKWGLDEQAVNKSLVAAVAGRVTTEQASRTLFGEITRPLNFIGFYFERYEGEKDLPFWMRKFGANMQDQALKLRAAISAVPAEFQGTLNYSFRKDLAQRLESIGTRVITALDPDDFEFGVTSELISRFAQDGDLSARVPASASMSRMMVRFALESTDKSSPLPQRSTGGDFIHALYAGHSDLWRGDRRFSHFLRGAVPEVAERIVSKLSELPERIQRFNDAR